MKIEIAALNNLDSDFEMSLKSDVNKESCLNTTKTLV